ncbi:GerW family sporulation protein [Priestia endophytica]|jgi:sporulation protein YtfJ|uniref:Sporulation protein YtfJ n=2 Tax=Priestia endophytica TaxID=135735 RepID=A0AAX1Q8U3_9BACI|nr:GerW family sporulation protein [Priestia endophytica]KAB2490515.1 sporulation protein YtfJ [Priestia endophytica]KYG36346.1 sporulation protein YtfJ [Priestia endophytica]MBG9815283.1 spore protein [Priestia endophytica]MCM3539894.1 GerW family sporulation protein [Priestia endophytica]RAS77684.1 sporulation protein YtfJ [Priestia endophytica]
MSEHPIEGLMSTAMENLKEMIDVNTIVGDPVETPDGSVILTVSKVGFGFAAGGSDFSTDGGKREGGSQSAHTPSKKERSPFGGGSGGGVSITPIAFLIVNSSGVKMLHLDESTHLYERLLETAPQAVEKIQGLFKKKEDGKKKGSSSDSHAKGIDPEA